MDYAQISDRLKAFRTISLGEMGKVKLMNRIDTKFVTTVDKIIGLLGVLSENYMVQEIDGESYLPYYTKYFDTADVDMFYQHQRGKKNRQKVRVRRYESGSTPPFVEIKTKNNKGRTKKKRVEMVNGTDLTRYEPFFSDYCRYNPSLLVPQIENHFYRITLVNRDMTERITIDLAVEFHNVKTNMSHHLNNIGIIEWKRDGRRGSSGLDSILRRMKIHPSGFSKYCVGMALTNPKLNRNRIKKKIRRINKMSAATGSTLETDGSTPGL